MLLSPCKIKEGDRIYQAGASRLQISPHRPPRGAPYLLPASRLPGGLCGRGRRRAPGGGGVPAVCGSRRWWHPTPPRGQSPSAPRERFPLGPLPPADSTGASWGHRSMNGFPGRGAGRSPVTRGGVKLSRLLRPLGHSHASPCAVRAQSWALGATPGLQLLWARYLGLSRRICKSCTHWSWLCVSVADPSYCHPQGGSWTCGEVCDPGGIVSGAARRARHTDTVTSVSRSVFGRIRAQGGKWRPS